MVHIYIKFCRGVGGARAVATVCEGKGTELDKRDEAVCW